MALRMDATVLSMLMTTPLRRPLDGLVPMPTMSMPSSVTLPTMAQIFGGTDVETDDQIFLFVC